MRFLKIGETGGFNITNFSENNRSINAEQENTIIRSPDPTNRF